MPPSIRIFAKKSTNSDFWVGYYGTEAWTLSCNIKRLTENDAIEDAQAMANNLLQQIGKEKIKIAIIRNHPYPEKSRDSG